jgi:hypothetical protein
VPGVFDSNVLKLKTKSFNYSLFNPSTLNCIPGSFSHRVMLFCVDLVHGESRVRRSYSFKAKLSDK